MTAPMKISPGKLKAAVAAAGCPTIKAGVSELISIIGKQRHDAEARSAQIKDMQADLVGQRSDVEEMLERMDRGDNRAAMEIGRDLLAHREKTREQRPAKPNIADVVAHVAAAFEVEPRDITGPSRQRVFVHPRYAAYLIAVRLGYSLPQIAARFNRDHTSVLVGRDRAMMMIGTDMDFKDRFDIAAKEVGI